MVWSIIKGGLKGALSSIEAKYLPYFIILGLVVVSVSAVKSCQQAEKINKEYVSRQAANARASFDTRQKMEFTLKKKQSDIVLKDSTIKALMDSLGIAEKRIKSLSVLKLERVVERVVTEYDTLYEFLELNTDIPNKFTSKQGDCLTVFGEFTPTGLKLRTESKLELYDFNYFQRDRLFNWKWTPRLGKKVYYQTLVTNCGDTITENKQITFER